ncbi:MAG: hypothetical protein K1X33_05040 [Methanobacteriaceae archaeon]|nr:hypothetical protein [Methanobacteriaceae archaeon]
MLAELDINLDDLREYLKIKGIDDSLYTDNVLEKLINFYTDYIVSYTGIDFDEHEHTVVDTCPIFRTNSYLLGFYPVVEIESIELDGNVINESSYKLDKNNGIIYWIDDSIDGDVLEIVYISQIRDNLILNTFVPLLKDMIYCSLEPNNKGNIVSVKEGDVTVTYDSNSTMSNFIINRLDLLKNLYYGSKTQMI